jgi:hypothetical protein
VKGKRIEADGVVTELKITYELGLVTKLEMLKYK